ncbi:MAG: DUF2344 domain-containing protein [Clostridia bacterium]|nr:DUF2344 domain-containing protein [Clostridia bacterium]
MNNTPINLRIKFKKVGTLQYISHLDLVRTMHKIVTRARLPLWYTEGFNPKPKMVFAAPLSIGTESVCEFMDLRLSERCDTEWAIRSLNENMTDELVVLDAYYPETKHTDLKWLGYTIEIDTLGASADLADRCNAAFLSESIRVNKKAKLGGAEMEIKPLIKSAVAEYRDGRIYLECILSADASAFLNPEYVVKYLKGSVGILSSENLFSEGYSIFRHSAYKGDMSPFA